MSTDTTEAPGDSPSERRITLTRAADEEFWSAVDEELGVASQGETREEALANLDEAVALHKGEISESVTDEDLREWGIDPETVPDEAEKPEAPWFDEEQS